MNQKDKDNYSKSFFKPGTNDNFKPLNGKSIYNILRILISVLVYFQLHSIRLVTQTFGVQSLVNLCDKALYSPSSVKLTFTIVLFKLFQWVSDEKLLDFTIELFVKANNLNGVLVLLLALPYGWKQDWYCILKGKYHMSMNDWQILGLIYIVISAYFT